MPTDLLYLLNALDPYPVEFFDLNLQVYQELNTDFTEYNLLKAILGGYIYSYTEAEALPFNEYPFEALPSLELLLILLYGKSFERPLARICKRNGIPFDTAEKVVTILNKTILNAALIMRDSDYIIFNLPSVVSVFTGFLLGKYCRQAKENIKIIAMGNQINVPQISKLGFTMDIFNQIIPSDPASVRKALGLPVIPKKGSNPPPISSALFRHNDYPLYYGLKIIPFETANGCPFNCNFCSERLFWDHHGNITDKYIKKPLDYTLSAIKNLAGELKLSGITLNDCMLNTSTEYSQKLFPLLAETPLLYSGSIRVDNLSHEFIQMLNQAHFTHLLIGLETVSNDSAKIYNKSKQNYSQKAWEMIPSLYTSGIIPQINIIIGHPYESFDDVTKSIKAAHHFADFLAEQEIPFYDLSVGSILINYPSENYFRVMNDPDFEIIYHQVPGELSGQISSEIAECIQSIPFKTVKKSSFSKVNKNDLCNELHNLSSRDYLKIMNIRVNALARHKDLILASWQERDINICFKKNDQIDTAKNESPAASLIFQLQKHEKISITSLLPLIHPEAKENLVATLLTLNLAGVVSLEKGNLS